MIALSSKPNVTAPTTKFPYGRLTDDTGVGDGTPVDQQTNNDIHSFLQGLMTQANLTPNGLLDNHDDGFQLNQALGILFKMALVNVGLGGADLSDGRGGGTINIPSGHDLNTLPSQGLSPFTGINGQQFFGGFFSVTSGATNVPSAGQAGTLIDVYGNSTEELQVFFTDTSLVYFRVKTSSAWGSWIQIGGGATAWTDVSSFGTNWSSVTGESKAQYRKDSNGRVWVKGTVSCSSVPSTGAVMFTLPVGFRPPAYSSGLYVGAPQSFTGSNVIVVKVDSAGEVIILFPGSSVTSGTVIQLGEFSFTTDGSIA